MTRPDKHAARFGPRYTFRGTPFETLPYGYTLARLIADMRQIADIFRELTTDERLRALGWRR